MYLEPKEDSDLRTIAKFTLPKVSWTIGLNASPIRSDSISHHATRRRPLKPTTALEFLNGIGRADMLEDVQQVIIGLEAIGLGRLDQAVDRGAGPSPSGRVGK